MKAGFIAMILPSPRPSLREREMAERAALDLLSEEKEE